MTSEKTDTHVPVFSLLLLRFENYERCFFNEILILIKIKNKNVCCFEVITNQTNHDNLFK